MEKVEIIEKQELLLNSFKLSVSSYEEYYDRVPLHPESVKQYQVDDDDLKRLLLSPRSRLHQNGYECCESCYISLAVTKKESNEYNPSRYAIANGFALGHIPLVISFVRKHDKFNTREINAERDLSDLVCVAISPVRPFGYVHAYTAGSQKSIKVHFSLFRIDQSQVGGALHKYHSTGAEYILSFKLLLLLFTEMGQ